MKAWCDSQVQVFLDICEQISFPVALEKTVWGNTLMVFLGLLIDTVKQLICIPQDKLQKALNMVSFFLNKRNGKATVLQFQRLTGYLNFLCHCIVPGRVFVRRLYLSGQDLKLKPHHHIRITKENRLDLQVWHKFLQHPEAFYKPFMEVNPITSEQVDLCSDASGSEVLGYGAFCRPEWCYGQWDAAFIRATQPSIEFLEMFAVAVAVLNWIKIFANKRIILFCDNQAMVAMINSMSSKCPHCMNLLRLIVLEGLVWNIKIGAKYINTKDNAKADALSRLDLARFKAISKDMNETPTPVPDELWPMEKVWKI